MEHERSNAVFPHLIRVHLFICSMGIRLLNSNQCQLNDGRRVYSGDADNGRHDTGQRWSVLECTRNWTDALWPKRNDITYIPTDVAGYRHHTWIPIYTATALASNFVLGPN